jgi:hypothetical protein
VNTLQEARSLQVRLCKLTYDGKRYLLGDVRPNAGPFPGAFSGELEDLDLVSDLLRRTHAEQVARRARKRSA